MRRTLLPALLLTLTACSGGGEDSEPKAPVSLRTTCDLLFNQDGGEFGLWGRATDVVVAQANDGTWNDTEAETVNTRLAEIAETSQPAIRPHVESMAEMLSGPDALNVDTYKASATEVSNQCAKYVAGS